jgi:hypothetical protein
MSEFLKLKEKYQTMNQAMNVYFRATFDSDVKELQETCKHEKTHWMQELTKEGDFKEGLFKRCFICGATIEKLEANDKAIELAMQAFDNAVENCEKEGHPK